MLAYTQQHSNCKQMYRYRLGYYRIRRPENSESDTTIRLGYRPFYQTTLLDRLHKFTPILDKIRDAKDHERIEVWRIDMKLWGIKTKHYPIRKLRPPFTDLQITDNVNTNYLQHALPLEGYKRMKYNFG